MNSALLFFLNLVFLTCILGQSLEPCNGYSELCDRRFNEVAYATTHNSFSTGFNPAANQRKSIEEQLDDGVRAFMMDVHRPTLYRSSYREMHLCHLSCSLIDRGPLVKTLKVIKRWLDANPREVISLIYENYDEFITADFIPAYTESGILDMSYTKEDPWAPWPTLQEMIDSNQRVVSTTDRLYDGYFPWMMYQFDHIWETAFSVRDEGSFDCTMDRPVDPERPPPLYVLNHFIYSNIGWGDWGIDVPDPLDAEKINGDALALHAETCREKRGIPNYVAVDFYDQGHIFEVVAKMNQVTYVSRPRRLFYSVSSSASALPLHPDGYWGSWVLTGVAVILLRYQMI